MLELIEIGPNDIRVVAGGDGGRLRVWNPAAGQDSDTVELVGHTDAVWALARLNPPADPSMGLSNRVLIASAGRDATVRLWHMHDLSRPSSILPTPSGVQSIASHNFPDRDPVLVVGGLDFIACVDIDSRF